MIRFTFTVITEDGPHEVIVDSETHTAALTTVSDKYPDGVVVGIKTQTVIEDIEDEE